MTACASIQLGEQAEPSTVAAKAQRDALEAAVGRLSDNPWSHADSENGGFVGVLFGAMGPRPKVLADAYLASFEDASATEMVSTVRSDAREVLGAALDVAEIGRDSSHIAAPARADLRLVETAIVKTRHARLVFSETMTTLARRDGTVERSEIRELKAGFDDAIVELGLTAEVLSEGLRRGGMSTSRFEPEPPVDAPTAPMDDSAAGV